MLTCGIEKGARMKECDQYAKLFGFYDTISSKRMLDCSPGSSLTKFSDILKIYLLINLMREEWKRKSQFRII